MKGDDAAASELDPSYAEMLKRAEEVGEAEERVGREPAPRGDYHIGHVTAISFREIPFNPPVAGAEITLQVDEGIPDAVGRYYRDTLRLEVGTQIGDKSLPRDEKGRLQLRDRTPTEQRQAEDAFIAQMKRIQRVLGTASLFPRSKDEAGVQEWGSPAVTAAQLGQKVIFTGYSDADGFTRIVFGSIRAPEDPAKDYRKKGHPVIDGKTAMEQAQEENERAALKSGGSYQRGGGAAVGGGKASSDF